MRLDFTVFAAIAALIVGFVAFWSNPSRTINRLFLSLSLHAILWLMALGTAFSSAEGSAMGLFWLRGSAGIGALFPLHFWVIQESLAAQLPNSWRAWIRQNWFWLLVSALLAAVPFSNAFIPAESTAVHRLRGWGYYAYIIVDVALYGILFRDAFKRLATLVGVRRLELQLWLGGGCVTAITVLGLMALTDITKDPSYIRLQPLIILLFYAVTAFAITTHQILDARQIVLVGLERSLLVAIVAGVAYVIHGALNYLLPEPFDFLVTTALVLWFAVSLNVWLDRVFHFYPQ
ncbi:MAG: hypothetical protein EBU34_14750, partial [Alphaproteobacteria bacterium]|nr:hypothetical protein [Alphaproteobacteria bacterium]